MSTTSLFVIVTLLLVQLSARVSAQTLPGTVLLDSYSGSTDDAKLSAALAAVQTQTYIPAIMLSPRTYTFTQTQTPFSGMKIVGPPAGYFDSELDGAHYNSVKVNLNVGNGTNSWMVATGTIYNVYIANIGFTSTNMASQFWHQPYATAGTLYACTFDTIGFMGFKYVFGNPTASAALTQINFNGEWTVLNPFGTQFTIGGSDNELWTHGYLNIGGSSSFNGGGKPLLNFESLGKTNIGPIYVTANNGWYGISVSGDTASGVGLSFTGARFEGQNPTTTSNGALVIQTGGKVIWRNIWVAYGMTDPSANGHSPVDQGMIMHTGGEALWDGVTYDRSSAVDQTVPLIYATAGKVRVKNVFVGTRGGAWTALPIIKNAGAAFVVDDTVTLS